MFLAKAFLKALYDRIVRVLVIVFGDWVCTPVYFKGFQLIGNMVICVVIEELKSWEHGL